MINSDFTFVGPGTLVTKPTRNGRRSYYGVVQFGELGEDLESVFNLACKAAKEEGDSCVGFHINNTQGAVEEGQVALLYDCHKLDLKNFPPSIPKSIQEAQGKIVWDCANEKGLWAGNGAPDMDTGSTDVNMGWESWSAYAKKSNFEKLSTQSDIVNVAESIEDHNDFEFVGEGILMSKDTKKVYSAATICNVSNSFRETYIRACEAALQEGPSCVGVAVHSTNADEVVLLYDMDKLKSQPQVPTILADGGAKLVSWTTGSASGAPNVELATASADKGWEHWFSYAKKTEQKGLLKKFRKSLRRSFTSSKRGFDI